MPEVCKKCGGPLKLSNRNGLELICEYCGETTRIDIENIPKNTVALLNAEAFLNYDLPDFSKALSEFNKIIATEPCHEAYWGAVRAKFGIKLVTDRETREEKPVCFKRINLKYKFTEDPLFLKAIDEKICNAKVREKYIRLGELIEHNRRVWKKITDNKPVKYDVFIAHDSNDVAFANEVYNILQNANKDKYFPKKLKIFYSPVSLKSETGGANGLVEYEPLIYDAIAESKMMIVVASKAEYFYGDWVSCEWNRFFYKQEFINKYAYLNAFISPDVEISEIPQYFIKHNNYSGKFSFAKTKGKIDKKFKKIPADYRSLIEEINSYFTIYADSEEENTEEIFDDVIENEFIKYKPTVVDFNDDTIFEIPQDFNEIESKKIIKREPIVATLVDKYYNVLQLFNADKPIYEKILDLCKKILKEQPDNIEVQYLAFLAKHKVKNISKLPLEAIKSFTNEEIDTLFYAVDFFIDDNETIGKQIIYYLCNSIPKLIPNYKTATHVIEKLSKHNESQVINEFVANSIKALDNNKKMPLSESFIDYLKALFLCANAKIKKTCFEKIIDSLLKHNAYGVAKSLLEKVQDNIGKTKLYEYSLMKLELKATSNIELINCLVKKEDYEELRNFIFTSSSQKQFNAYMTCLVNKIAADIKKSNFDVKRISDLFIFTFGFDFANHDLRLFDEIVSPLMNNDSKNACDLLCNILNSHYIGKDMAIVSYKKRIDLLLKKGNFDLALVFVESALKVDNHNLDIYYKKVLCQMHSKNFDSINIEYLSNYSPDKITLHNIENLSRLAGSEKLSYYRTVMSKILFALLKFLKTSRKNKDKSYELLRVFALLHKDSKEELISIYTQIIKYSFELSYFDKAGEYIDKLIEELPEPVQKMEYYLQRLQAYNKAKNAEELKHTLPCIDEYDEYICMSKIAQESPECANFFTRKINSILAAQTAFKKRRPLKNKIEMEKLRRKNNG